MNSQQQLLAYLDEIQGHIDSFKKTQIVSEYRYQELLASFTDVKLASPLMEHHLVHTERQKTAITKLEELHQKVRNLLASLK